MLHLLTRHLEQWGRQFRRGYESRVGKPHPLVMFALAIISLTIVVGDRFYNQPQLSEGTVSAQKIYAPDDGQFIDWRETQARRDDIRRGLVPILKRDETITNQIKGEIDEFIRQVERLRTIAGSFPFLDKNLISVSTQGYLRQCSDSSWDAILAAVENSRPWLSLDDSSQVDFPEQQAMGELLLYRQQASEQEFAEAIAFINLARQGYGKALQELVRERGTTEYGLKITFLELEEETWQQTENAIRRALERILIQGIPTGLTPNGLDEVIEIQLRYDISTDTSDNAIELLARVLQPNLIQDREAMKRKAEQAAETVEETIVTAKKGQLIVDQGETISWQDFVLLDGFGLSRRGINWQGLGISIAVVGSAVGIFWLAVWLVHRPMRCRDQILLSLLSGSTPLLVVFQIPYTNLPAIGLLSSSFYGSILAAVQVSLLSGLVWFTSGGGTALPCPYWEYLLAGMAGGLLAAFIAGRLRSREELALLGVGVGLIQVLVYLIVYLVSPGVRYVSGVLLYDLAKCGLSGVAWSVVALGISPYLERLFDLVTPIRLAELSNPNRPLLQKLATVAPGTFQHTMFVASLAEAAARELHGNVELVRAGTLYHDIGKMHDPLGFIENQMGGPNKHDSINDPWQSAQIIKKHVSEGLIMARKYGLPQAIRDFIPEHQGTLLISYFYFVAQERTAKEGRQVKIGDFRYDGPIPQSRESGIIMLADGCEAALRSLKDVTPEQALMTVEKIFRARWRDNQLKDSGLKKKELKTIARVFIRVWQQYNHKRIAYPKAALEPRSRG